jgi:hypothetical protein
MSSLEEQIASSTSQKVLETLRCMRLVAAVAARTTSVAVAVAVDLPL